MSDNHLVQLHIIENRVTEYRFLNDNTNQNNFIRLHYFGSKKGHGILSNHSFLSPGELIHVDKSSAMIPVGNHRNRICRYCNQMISKKAFRRNDCLWLYFCSNECLFFANDLIDILSTIYGENKAIKESTDAEILAITILYQATKHIDHIYYLLTLLNLFHTKKDHRDDNIENRIADDVKDVKHSYQSEYTSISTIIRHIQPILNMLSNRLKISFDDQILLKLLSVIRYNIQSMSILDLPSTQILCVFPTFSRLNHSCHPNCIIVYSDHNVEENTIISHHHHHEQHGNMVLNSIKDSNSNYTTKTVYGMLKCIRPIEYGEELTISYIKPLCLDVSHRRTLLFNAFHFQCYCNRCQYEESYSIHSNDGIDTSYMDSIRNDLMVFVNNYDLDNNSLEKNRSVKKKEIDSNHIMLYIEKANHLLNRIIINNLSYPYIYDIYDTYLIIVMILDKPIISSENGMTNDSILFDDKNEIRNVRVLLGCYQSLSKCMDRIGMNINVLKLEYLIKGITIGNTFLISIMISKYSSNNSNNIDLSELIEMGYTMATESIELLNILASSNSLLFIRVESILKQYQTIRKITAT